MKVERRGDFLIVDRLARVDQEKVRFTQKIVDVIASKSIVLPTGLIPGQLKVCMAEVASASIRSVYATS